MFSNQLKLFGCRQINRIIFSPRILNLTTKDVKEYKVAPPPQQLFTTHRGLSFSSRKCFPEDSASGVTTCFHVKDDEEFNSRVLHAKIPIVVDFHAEWCGPCKLLGPRLEKEVDSHAGKVMLAKVDVDNFGQLAMKYKVMVVPSVMLFKDGEVVDSFQGNVEEDALTDFVKKALD